MLVSQTELVEILREWESRYWNVTPGEPGRRAERFSVKWQTKVAVVDKSALAPPEYDDGYAINISATGLGLIARYAISPGDWCCCFLYPPAPNVPFLALAQAIWQKPVNDFFATGLSFIVWQDENEFDLALQLARTRDRATR